MARIDLHTHSTASDGTLTPRALVEAAGDGGLAAIALTDHDTVGGLAEARAAGARVGVEVVNGIEFSVGVRGYAAHLLGYGFDPEHPNLQRVIERARRTRDERNPRIIERLRALDVDVTLEEVEAKAAGRVGRPHVAAVLVEKGVVETVAEAFDRYLAAGRPAYVPRLPILAADAIAALHEAGGVAVVAHPVTLPADERLACLEEMVAGGLDGVEVVHTKQDADVRRELAAFAAEHDLLTTGGSDFHGDAKPEVALGSGRDGNVAVGYDVLEELRQRTSH